MVPGGPMIEHSKRKIEKAPEKSGIIRFSGLKSDVILTETVTLARAFHPSPSSRFLGCIEIHAYSLLPLPAPVGGLLAPSLNHLPALCSEHWPRPSSRT